MSPDDKQQRRQSDRLTLPKARESGEGEARRARFRNQQHIEVAVGVRVVREEVVGDRYEQEEPGFGYHDAQGVADENCRVPGIENLLIAGPSVFPTSGSANPMLTIVALALRLADQVKGILGGR